VRLADEAPHEIHLFVPGGLVPPWTTVKHREWRLCHYAWERTLTDDERALWLMRAPLQWPPAPLIFAYQLSKRSVR
jgi:hypothetical protein